MTMFKTTAGIVLGSTLLLLTPVFAVARPAEGAASGEPAPGGEGEPGAAPGVIAPEIKAGLETALKDKVSKLLEEKNAEGVSYKRGAYSKAYRKVDDQTYQVTFHLDTADEANMKTERFLLTLKKDPQKRGAWTIASEELQDTYSDSTRSAIKDITFHRFDSFSFDKEGMKAHVTKGSLYKTYRQGKVVGLSVWGPDISYDYRPPVEKFQPLWRNMQVRHKGDVVFQPGYIRITCDSVTCEEMLSRNFTGVAPATLETVDQPLRDRYNDAVSEWKKRMKDDWFTGFWPPEDPDQRRWDVEVGKSYFKWGDPGTAIGVSYDSWDPMEVSFNVYGLFEAYPFWDTVYAYYSEETRKKMTDPAALERRDDYQARDYDLRSLRGMVEMGVEDSELMSGDLTFQVRTKRELKRLAFFIARLNPERPDQREAKSPRMFVNSVRDGRGRELTFVKLGATYGVVLLPEPQPAGTDLTIRMQFENKDAIYKLTPSYSYVSRGGWLPFVRFGDMIDDFDLTVRVPANYTTLGIGKKVSEEVKDGVKITRWVPDKPVDFPTVIYGDYYEAESGVKVTRSDGTQIPVRIYVDKVGLADWEISPKALGAFADEAANAINLYSAVYGVDYPYAKLDLVNDPRGGLYGQAPSSIVYLGSVGFRKAAIASSGGGQMSKFVKSLVAHETAHQWWGSVIGNANYRNYWFVESLAEYSAALFVENVYSRKEYLEHVQDWRRRVMETDIEVSVQDAPVLWGGDDFGAYQAALYNKGPYVFHVMRSIWGDEKFFAFLKTLAQELKGKEIVTRDIQKVAEKAFGGTMDWFFDQWIRSVGVPEYTFTHTVRATEDGKFMVEGEIQQRLLYGIKKEPLEGQYFTTVVPITVTLGGGKEVQFKLKVEGPKTPFKFKVGEQPLEVVFNKYGEVLAYDIIKG